MLNHSWNLFQDSVIKAADMIILIHSARNSRRNKQPDNLVSVYKEIKILHKFNKITKLCLDDLNLSPKWYNLYHKFLLIAHSHSLNTVELCPSPPVCFLKSIFPDTKVLLAGLYVKSKLKEQQFKADSIRSALQSRIDDFNSDPSRMIDSILNRRKRIITLDRCLDNSHQDKLLLSTPDKIKYEVNRHFQQVAGTTHSNKNIPDDWQSTYQPLQNIDPTIYNELVTPPSADDWYRIIDQLPNGKAAGPSKISNEMLKHLGPQTKKFLWYIICGCLQISSVSNRLNLAFVYPIPKPKPWEFDLNNTRPITLLECPRKAFVKLLNSRLSSILIRHNILKGHNFAGLPFKSTFDPIHIIDNIKQDSLVRKSELWILLQDMSKAYDRVNIFMLVRALERLKIPFNFIRIILRIFLPRFNQIFTAYGNTEAYLVHSGIDQGEVISPLLWCIYYDPLLCKVQASDYGYEMNCTWRPNVRTTATTSLIEKIPALAFMDDTLWIAKSADDLTSITNIANSFFDLNDIQVNWAKSELLTSRKVATPFTIVHNNTAHQIVARLPSDSVRYLGIWISLANNKAFIVKQIHEEVKAAVTIMKNKHLTDKQLAYIFNTVIVSRIEYKSQLTLPSEQQCSRIVATYLAFVRKKLHLPRNTPTSCFTSRYLYNITHIHQRLVQNCSSAVLQMTNESNLLGASFDIRTRHLQQSEWFHENPLVLWPYDDHNKNDDWFTTLLSILNRLNIRLNISAVKSNTIQGGVTPISSIIPLNYRQHAKDFR